MNNNNTSLDAIEENNNKKTLQDYEVISVIGNGSFGTCFKVRDKKNNNLYVWKGINYDELSVDKQKSLLQEISVLRQLLHPNIVQYHHHLINNEAKCIFLVMEYCEGGDLAKLIRCARVEHKRFEEKYAWRVLNQLCQALQVCHNQLKEGAILHRDIKPANIFLDLKGNVKLGDFGLARHLQCNEQFAQSFVGTPYYMSPELVKGSKYNGKSDVWSLGCLIYELCALQPPFKGYEFKQLSKNIIQGQFVSIPQVFSKNLQDIIALMLEVQRKKRPNIDEILKEMKTLCNLNELGHEFPKYLDMELDFYQAIKTARIKLDYEENNSSFEDEQPQKCDLNASHNIFTPDLRLELFYSARRRIFNKTPVRQNSDPELYESVRCMQHGNKILTSSPAHVTNQVFDKTLNKRLADIRARESLLARKESNLKELEQKLNERELRLQELEKRLREQEKRLKEHLTINTLPSSTEICELPPPLPPRKTNKLDETYCSIDQDSPTQRQQPTIAKLDLSTLPNRKFFHSLRKVTFQSPKRFVTYKIESNCQEIRQDLLQGSLSSKTSSDNSENPISHKRKSFLSILKLSRSSKDITKTLLPTCNKTEDNTNKAITIQQPTEILAKCETAELNNMWTKENKRAAFDLWAAMNADKQQNANIVPPLRHKSRQSLRERNNFTQTRLRRSLMSTGVAGSQKSSTTKRNIILV